MFKKVRFKLVCVVGPLVIKQCEDDGLYYVFLDNKCLYDSKILKEAIDFANNPKF